MILNRTDDTEIKNAVQPKFLPVKELSLPELQMFYALSEVQLKRYYEPEEGLFLAESPNVIERALRAGYEPVSFLVEERFAQGSMKKILTGCDIENIQIPVYMAPLEVLKKLPGFEMTRGALCVMRRRPLLKAEELLKKAHRVAVLEEVMNPTNVGAIFRNAAALGMDAVLLTKGCADPLYRRAARVSMGTVFQIPWTYAEDSWCGSKTCPGSLKKLGFTLTAMALKEDSCSICDPRLAAADRLAVVLGTESTGLKEETIAACDYTVMIPMEHGVDSLNVAAASAVAFWELGRRK